MRGCEACSSPRAGSWQSTTRGGSFMTSGVFLCAAIGDRKPIPEAVGANYLYGTDGVLWRHHWAWYLWRSTLTLWLQSLSLFLSQRQVEYNTQAGYARLKMKIELFHNIAISFKCIWAPIIQTSDSLVRLLLFRLTSLASEIPIVSPKGGVLPL